MAITRTLARMNFAELGDQLSTELSTQPEPILDQPPASAVPPVEQTVPVQPVQQPTEEERGRFRLEGEDARFARLRKEGVSHEQAYAIAYGVPLAPPQAPAAKEPEPEQPSEYEAAQSRLVEIEATLESLVDEAGDVGVTLTPDVLALQREQAALIRKTAKLEALAEVHGERQAEEADYSFTEAANQVQAQAIDAYPDLTNPDSALFIAVQTRVNALVAANDPLLDNPDAALMIAATEATKLRIAPQSKTPTGGQPAGQPQASPPRAFAPASGGNASSAHRIEVATAGPSDQIKQNLAALTQSGNGSNFAAIGSALSFGDGEPPPRVRIW